MAIIYGTIENDVTDGLLETDTIQVLAGDDTVRGFEDNDSISGEAGNDFLNGNMGDDTVDGGEGDDIVRGGKNNDLVIGGAGNDTLFGDLGADILIGGDGADVFYLRRNSLGTDVVVDFTPGVDKFEFVDDLRSSDILMSQGTGANAADTIITDQVTGQILAIVQGVSRGAIALEPTPTPKPTSDPTSNNWLDRVNYLRSLANLPPVSNNPEWTQGAIEHSRYMVKNNDITHHQDPNNPWYTPAGAEAGQKGNVGGSSITQKPDVDFINGWMLGPFHGLGIIDPQLTQVAYGAYSEADGGIEAGATLDVIRGINHNSSPQYPVMWPANGKTVPFRELGRETPDPITGVGYSYPAGMPIYLQLGPGNITPNVTSHSLTRNNTPIAHAVFDETNFQAGASEREQWQGTAINILDQRDAVVMIPKDPLTPGDYTASITANGQNYTWSFNVV